MRKMEGKVGEIHSQKSHFTTWPAKRDKWSFKVKSFEFSRQKSPETFLAIFHPCVNKLTFDYLFRFWEWHFVEKAGKKNKERRKIISTEINQENTYKNQEIEGKK